MSGSSGKLYWLVGDRTLTEERWRQLVGSQDLVRFDGRRLDLSALSNEVATLPMFSDSKCVLIQDFRLPTRRGGDEDDEKTDSDADARLLKAFSGLAPSVTVILVSETGDRRTRLFKLVQALGAYEEFTGFREYETAKVVGWVTARLKALGKSIQPAIAAAIVDVVGTDLGMLSSEIEKLAVAMGSDPTVSESHLDVICGAPSTLRRMIEDGILRKRTPYALELLRQTLGSNEHPIRIVNFLIPRFRDLLKARLSPDARRNADAAAPLFGNLHPFRLQSLYQDADRFTVVELRRSLHSLLIADTCLKSSVEPERVMTLLVACLSGAIDHRSFAASMRSYVEPWD